MPVYVVPPGRYAKWKAVYPGSAPAGFGRTARTGSLLSLPALWAVPLRRRAGIRKTRRGRRRPALHRRPVPAERRRKTGAAAPPGSEPARRPPFARGSIGLLNTVRPTRNDPENPRRWAGGLHTGETRFLPRQIIRNETTAHGTAVPEFSG